MVEFVKALVALYTGEEREGQGLVEYALIIALIAILLIGALTGLKDAIAGVFAEISAAF